MLSKITKKIKNLINNIKKLFSEPEENTIEVTKVEIKLDPSLQDLYKMCIKIASCMVIFRAVMYCIDKGLDVAYRFASVLILLS